MTRKILNTAIIAAIILALTDIIISCCTPNYELYKDYYDKTEKFIYELDSIHYLDDTIDTETFDAYKRASNAIRRNT